MTGSFHLYHSPHVITLLFALSFEWGKAGSDNRIHSLFERALADDKLQKSVNLSCCGFILAYCLITNHYIFILGSTGTPVGNKNGESISE